MPDFHPNKAHSRQLFDFSKLCHFISLLKLHTDSAFVDQVTANCFYFRLKNIYRTDFIITVNQKD
jgi:hypothetical protein